MKTRKNKPELRFPRYHEKWEKHIIENMFEFKNGLNKEKEFFGKGTPIINFRDVYNLTSIRKNDIQGLVSLSRKEIGNYSAHLGDVFFTRTSETINDIGMCATLVEEIPNCVFSGFVLRARPKNKKLYPLFTSYCFNIESIRKEIVTKSSFTTRALTSGTLLNKVMFSFPRDIEEQKKIATFLYTIDEKLKIIKKKKALLEEYKKGIMQKIFSQKIRFKGDNGKEFSRWNKAKLDKVATKINSGKTPLGGERVYSESGILFIRSQNVIDNKLSFENATYISDELNKTMKNSIVKPQDILLNITGASLGRSCVVPSNFTIGNVNQHVCIIRINESNNPYFIQAYLSTKDGQNRLLSLQTGSGREGLNFHSIKNFQIDFPCLEEQTKIANFLTAIDQKINHCQTQIELTTNWKKGLLQKMFC